MAVVQHRLQLALQNDEQLVRDHARFCNDVARRKRSLLCRLGQLLKLLFTELHENGHRTNKRDNLLMIHCEFQLSLFSSKYCRTFAAIWRSVILSTVSIPTMCVARLFFSRRSFSSP